MFDVGFFEILLICLVALLVLGPDRLPHAARMTGSFVGKLKRMYIDAKIKITEQVELQELQHRLKEIEDKQHELTSDITNPKASSNQSPDTSQNKEPSKKEPSTID